jgi:uncharacterized protein YcnI
MKKALVSLLAAATVLMTAAPAWAHEEINPPTVSTGKPTFFSLSAANEKQIALTQVTLHGPNGTPFGEATRQPAGWTVERTEDTITWSGGSVAPASFEQWGFEIEGADQPGALTFRVTMVFANGSSENANVVVTAVAAGSTGSPGTTVTTAAGGAGTTAVTSGTSEPASGTTAPPSTTDKKDSSSNGLSVVATAMAAAALALSLIALAQARRRGTTGPAPVSTGAEKDW